MPEKPVDYVRRVAGVTDAEFNLLMEALPDEPMAKSRFAPFVAVCRSGGIFGCW